MTKVRIYPGRKRRKERGEHNLKAFMFQSTMSNGTIMPKGKTFKLRGAILQGWVSRNEGHGLGVVLERFGWKKKAGPAASVVVTLGVNGSQILGSRWTVQGSLGEVNLKVATLCGEKEYNYKIGINLNFVINIGCRSRTTCRGGWIARIWGFL